MMESEQNWIEVGNIPKFEPIEIKEFTITPSYKFGDNKYTFNIISNNDILSHKAYFVINNASCGVQYWKNQTENKYEYNFIHPENVDNPKYGAYCYKNNIIFYIFDTTEDLSLNEQMQKSFDILEQSGKCLNKPFVDLKITPPDNIKTIQIFSVRIDNGKTILQCSTICTDVLLVIDNKFENINFRVLNNCIEFDKEIINALIGAFYYNYKTVIYAISHKHLEYYAAQKWFDGVVDLVCKKETDIVLQNHNVQKLKIINVENLKDKTIFDYDDNSIYLTTKHVFVVDTKIVKDLEFDITYDRISFYKGVEKSDHFGAFKYQDTVCFYTFSQKCIQNNNIQYLIGNAVDLVSRKKLVKLTDALDQVEQQPISKLEIYENKLIFTLKKSKVFANAIFVFNKYYRYKECKLHTFERTNLTKSVEFGRGTKEFGTHNLRYGCFKCNHTYVFYAFNNYNYLSSEELYDQIVLYCLNNVLPIKSKYEIIDDVQTIPENNVDNIRTNSDNILDIPVDKIQAMVENNEIDIENVNNASFKAVCDYTKTNVRFLVDYFKTFDIKINSRRRKFFISQVKKLGNQELNELCTVCKVFYNTDTSIIYNCTLNLSNLIYKIEKYSDVDKYYLSITPNNFDHILYYARDVNNNKVSGWLINNKEKFT